MRLQAVLKEVRLLELHLDRKFGILLLAILLLEPQRLVVEILQGMQHQAMEEQHPVHAKIDGMRLLRPNVVSLGTYSINLFLTSGGQSATD